MLTSDVERHDSPITDHRYQLKSLDGVAISPDAQQSVIFPCGANRTKVCMFVKHENSPFQRKRPTFFGKVPLTTPMVHAGKYSLRDPWAVGARFNSMVLARLFVRLFGSQQDLRR
jgi:hypothetical protein